MAKFRHHLFVCTNERTPDDPRGACCNKGSRELASEFKKRAHDRGLKRIVRINKAGCLDQCAHGATCVVYPGAVWYGGVTLADVDEIIEKHLLGGEPVERLRISDDELSGKE
jgi:(2Fe-2S) ferredoxin